MRSLHLLVYFLLCATAKRAVGAQNQKSQPLDDPELKTKQRNGVVSASSRDLVKKNCILEENTFNTTVPDEVISCKKNSELECYSSKDLIFDTYKSEVCEDVYVKDCQISFLEETKVIDVQICMTTLQRVCNATSTSSNVFTNATSTSCIKVNETVCESYYHQYITSFDYADCHVEISEKNATCAKEPRLMCNNTLTTNITKEILETKCWKKTKTLCGPDDCPIKAAPQICFNETRKVSSKIPIEECHLNTVKDCKDLTLYIPTLLDIEKCINVSKEICKTEIVPRLVIQTTFNLVCDNNNQSLTASTTSTTSTTTTTTTTTAVATGGEVILIIGGDMTDVEIYNISSKHICKKPSAFPNDLWSGVGFISPDKKPVACGDTGECYYYDKGHWSPFYNIPTSARRTFASALEFKTQNTSLIFVSGGYIYDYDMGLRNIETLTDQGWMNFTTSLPIPLWGHCMVQLNSSSIMFIAGSVSVDVFTNATYILNIFTKKWTQGPNLKAARNGHICFVLKDNNVTAKVMVAGGFTYGGILRSTEIWDIGSNAWAIGPDIPQLDGLSHSAGVLDASGNAYLVAGTRRTDYIATNHVFRLNDNHTVWTQIQSTMAERSFHVALVLKDENLMECQP